MPELKIYTTIEIDGETQLDLECGYIDTLRDQLELFEKTNEKYKKTQQHIINNIKF